MSRSNPTADRNPNPAQRFFEWKGKAGVLQYYDKQKEEIVQVKLPFTFIALDQLSTITGYNKKLQTGIYANEIRDIKKERFVVNYFKGGKIAEGFYDEIRDRITSRAVGAVFAKSVYIAYKDGDTFKIGNLRMTGCALSPWFEFAKLNQKAINEKAVVINQGPLSDEGEIPFYPPAFGLKDVSADTNNIAIALDKELQEYLKSYFGRTVATQVAAHAELPQPDAPQEASQPDAEMEVSTGDDEIPF